MEVRFDVEGIGARGKIKGLKTSLVVSKDQDSIFHDSWKKGEERYFQI